MEIKLANRIQRVKPSATLAVASKAAELKAKGKNIIGLGTGEPDFDTPEPIKEAAIKAINKGYTKYTPVGGTIELKEAIKTKFKKENQLDYQISQILVSTGAKQSIYNLCQALLNEGDEVIIPSPYWVSYPEIVRLAGGKPVIVEAEFDQHYKITAEQLEEAINPKTRLIMFNSPSNPTGMAYSQEELEKLAEVLLEYPHVIVASDDIYEHILWTEEPFSNIVNACPELYERSVVINGVSKAYAMTGWRIGYCAGPEKLIAAMTKNQSQSTSNPNSIAQHAAVAALNLDPKIVKDMTAAFKARHDLVYAGLKSITNLYVAPSDGTFYSFPDVSWFIEKNANFDDDIQFAEQLLEQTGLALVPGTAFGAPGCIRLSFAVDNKVLQDAIGRLQNFLMP